MILNHEEIKNKNIFDPKTFNNNQFFNCGYDLRIGHFVNRGSDEVLAKVRLEPRGLIIAISMEAFTMPKDVVGYTTLKNAVSSKGIMAINVGIVDPEYKGPISSVLINFGKEDVYLNVEDSFLRMTFHEFKTPEVSVQKPWSITAQKYIKDKEIAARAYFEDTFLCIDTVKKEVSDKVIEDIINKNKKDVEQFNKKVTSLGVLIGFISVLLIVVFTFINRKSYNVEIETKLKYIEKQLQDQNAKNSVEKPYTPAK